MIKKRKLQKRIAQLEGRVSSIEKRNQLRDIELCSHQFVFKNRMQVDPLSYAEDRETYKDHKNNFGEFHCLKCEKIEERRLTGEEQKAINLLNGMKNA